MKLLVKIITSKLEYAPRKVPDEKDIMETDSHLFSAIPRHFLPGIKSPCWYKEYNESSGKPYRRNLYMLQSKHVRAVYNRLKMNFRQHLHYKDGKTFRLRCLPFFYIIGQPKCGTTDLHNSLLLHPDVKFNTLKEPHWWTRRRFGPELAENQKRIPLEDYLDLFDLAAHNIQNAISGYSSGDHRAPQFITGEASASTMWDNRAWYNVRKDKNESETTFLVQDFIHTVQPNAKIIIILRDPVERLYSDYLYFQRNNKSAEDFHQRVVESLQLFQFCLFENSLRTCVYNISLVKTLPVRLHLGMYVVFLLDWLTVFHREQILVLQLEDYSANLKGTLKKVLNFLDVGLLSEQEETALVKKPRSNGRALANRNLGPMLPATRDILREFHQPFNHKLASVLDNKAFLWNTA
ncbi:carbohydrate sulfotransferase 15 [Brachionichthys hirsutus]|uniref:carbohydrate sulfotransferase 15 n=1 Tax=Brachionichthys hirsutus TaxID=412623 RepID=UPI00360514ED